MNREITNSCRGDSDEVGTIAAARHCSALAMVVVSVAPASGATPTPNGTGKVLDCKITGSIQFKPALVNGGTQPTTIKIKLKSAKGTLCTGGTGDGANVATVQVAGSGSILTNDCNSFFSPSSAVALPLTAKWKMAKGATPKKISNTLAGVSTLQTGPFAPVLPSVVHYAIGFESGFIPAGSFAGNTANLLAAVDQTTADVAGACGAKGLKKLTIGVKANSADGFKGFGDFGASHERATTRAARDRDDAQQPVGTDLGAAAVSPRLGCR